MEQMKGQYESWWLIGKLMQVDKLKFTYRKPANEVANQECPKTLVDNLTLKDHKKLVVHQVARWLEDIYIPNFDLRSLPQLNNKNSF